MSVSTKLYGSDTVSQISNLEVFQYQTDTDINIGPVHL